MVVSPCMNAPRDILLIGLTCLCLAAGCGAGEGGEGVGAPGIGGEDTVADAGVGRTDDVIGPDAADDIAGVDDAEGDGAEAHELCAPPVDGVSPGFKLTNQLASMTLKSCDGEPVDLLGFCGATGMWIFLAHGWCPYCKVTTSIQEEVHDAWSPYGLTSINVLVQSPSYGPPTPEDCKQWALQGGLEDVVALYDDSGASQAFWETNFTALNVFVDEQQIITSKIHSDVRSEIEQELETLLTP